MTELIKNMLIEEPEEIKKYVTGLFKNKQNEHQKKISGIQNTITDKLESKFIEHKKSNL